jgi:UDP-N-acetylmuramoylalanine--D-glutamate ligase
VVHQQRIEAQVSGLGDVLVLGLGRSGEAVARYVARLVAAGEASSVALCDAAETPDLVVRALELAALDVDVTLGTSEIEGRFDLCVASPGIPPHAEIMRSARDRCDAVVSEIEFAYMRSQTTWAAITGTNGKTTTTALLAHLLRTGGIVAEAVGNIGVPATSAIESVAEVLVAEVSSFQLALTKTFHPKVAVLLNITPDHTDWHGSLEAYAADKTRVFANMTEADIAVIDVDDPGSAPYADIVESRGIPVVRVSLERAFVRGATLSDGVLVLDTEGGPVHLVPADELLIRGSHNVSNALAAAAAAHALGVTPAALREGLRTFRPIEHRLEPVAIVGGVEWFNDSKATNPDAVFKALHAFGDKPLVVLLGGRNKHNDFTALAHEVAETTRAAVLFGEAREELAEAFARVDVPTAEAATLAEAVLAAAQIAETGDVVVLSPACASFDEFRSYEHRGEVFKRLVAELSGGEAS